MWLIYYATEDKNIQATVFMFTFKKVMFYYDILKQL